MCKMKFDVWYNPFINRLARTASNTCETPLILSTSLDRVSGFYLENGMKETQLTQRNGWRAFISINKKVKYFSTRATMDEAISDRKNAEIEYYGEYKGDSYV